MALQPGLPFLLPYVRQYTLLGEAILRDVFSFASYSPEAVLAQFYSSRIESGFLHRFLACIYH